MQTGKLTGLVELNMDENKLKRLPSEIGKMVSLEVLRCGVAVSCLMSHVSCLSSFSLFLNEIFALVSMKMTSTTSPMSCTASTI